MSDQGYLDIEITLLLHVKKRVKMKSTQWNVTRKKKIKGIYYQPDNIYYYNLPL